MRRDGFSQPQDDHDLTRELERLWRFAAEQQHRLEELERAPRWRNLSRGWVMAAIAVGMVVGLTGVTVAAGSMVSNPVSSNVVHGCYSKTTGAVTVPSGPSCPNGTKALDWNQYTQIAATSPLSVAAGSNGSPPKVSISGAVPSAVSFTGSLSGDVSGTQKNTRVVGLRGVPISPTAPTEGQVLRFDGTHWSPMGIFSPTKLATLHWYTVNTGGYLVNVGEKPVGIAFDGFHMWVANNISNSVTEIDIATKTVMATVPVCCNPYALAFDGSHVWVTTAGSNQGTPTATEINGSTQTVMTQIPVPANPEGIAFDGANLWVASHDANSLTEINAHSATLMETIAVGNGPTGVAFDGSNVWVTNSGSGTVSKVAAATATVVGTANVGLDPIGVVFDGNHVWVANNGSGSVSEIDPKATPIPAPVSISCPTNPFWLTADGDHIWVTDNVHAYVSVIDALNPAPPGAHTPVMNTPEGVAFDGNDVWVVNHDSNTVSFL